MKTTIYLKQKSQSIFQATNAFPWNNFTTYILESPKLELYNSRYRTFKKMLQAELGFLKIRNWSLRPPKMKLLKGQILVAKRVAPEFCFYYLFKVSNEVPQIC